MKQITIFLVLFVIISLSNLANCQTSGKIFYNISHNWSKKMLNCKYLSKTDRENSSYVWGSNNEYIEKGILTFNENFNIFENIPNEEYERYYSSRKENYYIYRDVEKNKMLNIQKVLGKEYAIEDSIHCINWKIRNDMKEVAGHICMNAYYYDTIRDKEIVAWFALDMPIAIGPDGYCGLPGAILELDMNNGSQIYTATNIIPSDEPLKITIPEIKKKTKVISYNDFVEMENKSILESKKLTRPYFWQISY
ncbi:MAG: GLPGLI family protein [Bacteroidales bacterium]|jgi:GLPGLI family protein|nr:GLPGLI family protein [Bacteroidales bacterium]